MYLFPALLWRVIPKWEEEFLVLIILQRKEGKYFHTTFVFKDHTLIATVPWGRRQIAKDNIQDMRRNNRGRNVTTIKKISFSYRLTSLMSLTFHYNVLKIK